MTRSDQLVEARVVLESGISNPKEIAHAIVTIGKPLDASVLNENAPLIATFLEHENFIVRYQAIWFLGCWGRLPGYLDKLIGAMERDSDLDNRAFAARCLGRILKKSKQKGAVVILLNTVDSNLEEIDVRLAAYSGLLHAWSRPEYLDFEPSGSKSIKDMNAEFIEEVKRWISKQT
jgi:HEAT repeat protein